MARKNCIICGRDFDAKGGYKTCSPECKKTLYLDGRRRRYRANSTVYELRPCAVCGRVFRPICLANVCCQKMCSKKRQRQQIRDWGQVKRQDPLYRQKVAEKDKARKSTPEYQERMRQLAKTPEYRERQKKYNEKYHSKPENRGLRKKWVKLRIERMKADPKNHDAYIEFRKRCNERVRKWRAISEVYQEWRERYRERDRIRKKEWRDSRRAWEFAYALGQFFSSPLLRKLDEVNRSNEPRRLAK